MRQRKVSASQVERAISHPTRNYPSTNPPGRLITEFDTALGNTLRVVYIERPHPHGIEAYVITVIRIGRTQI